MVFKLTSTRLCHSVKKVFAHKFKTVSVELTRSATNCHTRQLEEALKPGLCLWTSSTRALNSLNLMLTITMPLSKLKRIKNGSMRTKRDHSLCPRDRSQVTQSTVTLTWVKLLPSLKTWVDQSSACFRRTFKVFHSLEPLSADIMRMPRLISVQDGIKLVCSILLHAIISLATMKRWIQALTQTLFITDSLRLHTWMS